MPPTWFSSGLHQVLREPPGSPPCVVLAACWGWVLAAPPSAKNQARAGLRSWKLKFFCPHHPNKSQRGHSPPCAPKPSRGGAGGGVLGGTRPLLRAPRPPSCPCLISCCSSGLTRRGRGAAVGSLAVLGGVSSGEAGGRRGGGGKAIPSPSPCRPTGMQPRSPLNACFLAIHHGTQTLLRSTLYVINYILMINYALVMQTAASRCC